MHNEYRSWLCWLFSSKVCVVCSIYLVFLCCVFNYLVCVVCSIYLVFLFILFFDDGIHLFLNFKKLREDSAISA